MASLSAPCLGPTSFPGPFPWLGGGAEPWERCWLEPPEDPLLYTVGDEDNKNPPQYILDIALSGGSGWEEIYPKANQGETPEKLG